jgi:cell division protein FtsB
MLGGVLAGLVFNALRSPMGPEDLLVLRHHGTILTAERDRVEADNTRLQDEIARLKSDDAYLQSLIRQQLGYVRPGEVVYRFPQSEQ